MAGNPGNDRLNGGTGGDLIEAADGTRDAAVFDSGLDRFPDGFSDCKVRKPR